jgi:hypothetical protein
MPTSGQNVAELPDASRKRRRMSSRPACGRRKSPIPAHCPAGLPERQEHAEKSMNLVNCTHFQEKNGETGFGGLLL